MAGRRVARRRLASFVQQLDGSGGGSLLLARRQKSVVVAKIGGVIKDSSSSSSSSLESFESQSGAFCPFLGGKKIPLYFFNEVFERKKCVSFFLPKTHFFLRLFFWSKSLHKKTYDSKSHFWTVSRRAQTYPRRRPFTRRPQTPRERLF